MTELEKKNLEAIIARDKLSQLYQVVLVRYSITLRRFFNIPLADLDLKPEKLRNQQYYFIKNFLSILEVSKKLAKNESEKNKIQALIASITQELQEIELYLDLDISQYN